MTWILEDDEPDVVSRFRIEADPVVNANLIAYLGDHPETRDARRWLEALITKGNLEGSSKWYPDEVAICYATARAMIRARPALDRLRPILAERILGLRDDNGDFGNILQTGSGRLYAPPCRMPRQGRRETRGGKIHGFAARGRQLAGTPRVRRPDAEVGHGRAD